MLAALLALIPFIGSLFAKSIEFFVKKVTWKVLVYGLYVLSYISLILAFYVAIDAIVSVFQTSLPVSYTYILTDIMPSNTPAVLTAVFTMEITAMLLNYKKRLLAYRTVKSNV